MPRPKKAPGTAVDKRNGQQIVISDPATRVEPFRAPGGLTKRAYEVWDDFWKDRPALLLTPASKVVLVRWIEAISRYERCIHEADLLPLVDGSHGNRVTNPLYKIADQALKTVQSCEEQLGIGIMNATRLGIAAIAEQQRLGDLNARYEGPGTPQEGSDDSPSGAVGAGAPRTVRSKAEEVDPRLLDDDELLS
jgi:hypothetical protein